MEERLIAEVKEGFLKLIKSLNLKKYIFPAQVKKCSLKRPNRFFFFFVCVYMLYYKRGNGGGGGDIDSRNL